MPENRVTASPALSSRATALSYILTAFVVVASAAGLLVERIYALETPSFAAQGIGQDAVNMLVAVPALAVSAYLARRGSLKALLVWAGALVYLVYSYIVYAFYVHFGLLFPLYVAILSLSFYLLLSTLLFADLNRVGRSFSKEAPIRLVGNFLYILSGLFYLLWGSEVIRSLLSATAPQSAIESGLPVSPVHVLDMAILLPALAMTAFLLRKNRPIGHFMAAPLLVCVIIIGSAVLGMVVVMLIRGVPAAYPVMIAIGASTASSLFVLTRYLQGMREK